MVTPQSINAPQKPLVKLANSKFNTIQAFRFIAAFMVLVFHNMLYTSERLVNTGLDYDPGGNGVELFFAISGFVMIWSSQRLVNQPGGWRTFAWKRILRVVPLYWLVMTVKLLIMLKSPAVALHVKIDFIYILKSYLFIPAKNIDGEFMPFYGVGWTLNFEMFFYLLFTIALAFRIKALPFLSSVFLPLSVIAFFVSVQTQNPLAFYANLRVLNFLGGMIAAQVILHNRLIANRPAIALIIVGFLILAITPQEIAGTLPQISRIPVIIATFMIVYGGACIEPLIGHKLPAWLIFGGAASYSLYLIHPTAGPVAPAILSKLHFIHAVPSILLGIVLSLIAAALLYRYCEKPLTNFLTKKIIPRKKSEAVK